MIEELEARVGIGLVHPVFPRLFYPVPRTFQHFYPTAHPNPAYLFVDSFVGHLWGLISSRWSVRHFSETPLEWAASSDDVDALDALIEDGANIEADGASIAGGTALDKRMFHPQNFRVQLSSELLAIRVSFAQLFETYRGLNGALATQVDEMRHEGHVLPVTDLLAHVAVVERILDQARRQRMSLSGGWFQQRRLERQNGVTV